MLHDDVVTIVRTTAGDPVEGIPTETTTEQRIPRVNVQPVGTVESVGAVEGPVTSRWRVSTSTLEDWVKSDDRCVWNGETFRVLGRPQTYRHGIPHTEFIITETEG